MSLVEKVASVKIKIENRPKQKKDRKASESSTTAVLYSCCFKSVYLSVCLSVHLSICPCIYLNVDKGVLETYKISKIQGFQAEHYPKYHTPISGCVAVFHINTAKDTRDIKENKI